MFGLEKTSGSHFGKTLAVCWNGLHFGKARQYSKVLRDGYEFWHTLEQQKSPPVRNRSSEQGLILKASNISLIEIHGALDIARQDNAGGYDDDLIRSAAQLLGFKRAGPDLKARHEAGLQ